MALDQFLSALHAMNQDGLTDTLRLILPSALRDTHLCASKPLNRALGIPEDRVDTQSNNSKRHKVISKAISAIFTTSH